MPYIQLKTGKTVYLSTFDFLFKTVGGKVEPITDSEIDEFFQNCHADDRGNFIEDPFTEKLSADLLQIEEKEEINVEEPEIDEAEFDD